jgi:gamma-glutamyl-gamma-aminobutyraldehyde dehydrogenase
MSRWRSTCAAVGNTVRWFGEAIDKVVDEIPHVDPGALALVTREAAGVVGAIVPWNFPLTMAAWNWPRHWQRAARWC